MTTPPPGPPGPLPYGPPVGPYRPSVPPPGPSAGWVVAAVAAAALTASLLLGGLVAVFLPDEDPESRSVCARTAEVVADTAAVDEREFTIEPSDGEVVDVQDLSVREAAALGAGAEHLDVYEAAGWVSSSYAEVRSGSRTYHVLFSELADRSSAVTFHEETSVLECERLVDGPLPAGPGVVAGVVGVGESEELRAQWVEDSYAITVIAPNDSASDVEWFLGLVREMQAR